MFLNRSAHRHGVDAHRGHANAHRHALPFLAADADAAVDGDFRARDGGGGVCLLAYNKNWIQNDPYNVKYWEKKEGYATRSSSKMNL